MYYAIRPVYNRRTRSYVVQTVQIGKGEYASMAGLLDAGFFVYQDAGYAIKGIKNGSFLHSWPEAKRNAVLRYLEG